MSNRRVKDIAYDEDDLDDDYYSDGYEEGGDELSAEDKAQMAQCTPLVRAQLGDIQVTDGEIQEALWNYYYDVGKSATYLKNKHAPKSPKPQASQKKTKPVSRFDQAAAASAATAQPTKASGKSTFSDSNHMYPMAVYRPASAGSGIGADPNDPVPAVTFPLLIPSCETPLSAADFFADTPWLRVPIHRQGHITCEPLYPPGRLLGGSAKPSKLAALAAARRKKQEESKSAEAGSPATANPGSKEPDRTISLLDRLSVQEKKENAPPNRTQPVKSSLASLSRSAQLPRSYPARPKQSSPPPVEEKKEPPPQREPEKPKPEVIRVQQDLRAPPSAFGTTIFGHRLTREKSAPRQQDHSLFPVPYATEPDFAKHNPFAGPSPDDVVLNAQAKGNLGKKAPAGTKQAPKSTNGVTAGISELTVEESPRVKCKNLDVAKEFEKANRKKAANFVVVGHVDHGKSTLMGRLLYDLKVVDQRSLDRLRKEAETIGKSSFALAWVMDQTSDERERGVTVDIATNNFETEKTRFTILDAPGHKDFVPNMIAGASQADFAVLVIDSSPNSFEAGLRGQTKEHALLVRSMGVARLIVVINKMDMANWSEERFKEISQQMGAFLTTAGFQEKNLAFVPCSGLTGENIVKPVSKEKAPWYQGRTLVEELDASEPATRAVTQPLRLTISDIFRGSLTNPLSISGRIEAGNVQVGEELLAMPSGEKAFVKGIEADNEPVDWAVAGQIVTLHLTDIDPVHLRVGDIVCAPSNPIRNIKRFTAKILAFDHVMPMYVDVFRGRLHGPAKITRLLATLDKTTGEPGRKKPKIVQPGTVARIEVEMEKEIPLEPPSRVVLRAGGATLAAGLLEEAS